MGEEMYAPTKRHVPWIWLLGGVVIVLALGAAGAQWVYTSLHDQSTELSSGAYNLTHAQYEALIKQAKTLGTDEADARTALQQSLYVENAAHQLGIDINSYQSAVTLAAISDYKLSPDATPNDYEMRSKYSEAINTYLTFAEQGGYKFATFEFPFTRYIWAQLSPAGTPDQKKNAGNLDAIRADMTYAKQQADAIHVALTSGKMTPDQAIAKITADSRLSYGYSANDSQILTMGLSGSRQLSGGLTVQYDPSVLKQLGTLKPGTIGSVTDAIGPLEGSLKYPPELAVNASSMKIGYVFTYLIDKRDPSPGLAIRYSEKLREVSHV